MPSDLGDGPPVGFLVFFAVVLLLIVVGIVRAVIRTGGTATHGTRSPLPGDPGAREHQRIVDQQILQQGMTGLPPETGGMHGGHHHVDHTPPPADHAPPPPSHSA